MSGWRDTEGRTQGQRKQEQRTVERQHFVDRVRHRPLSSLRPALILVFLLIVAAALVLRM